MTFFSLFVILCLSGLLGYALVWQVTPSLHAPLMALTNAVSSVIVIGAFMLLSGMKVVDGTAGLLLLLAIALCMLNIVGGFWISYRMLSMFKGNK